MAHGTGEISNLFIQQFAPVLGNTDRWIAFNYIWEALKQKREPVHILETGCARDEGNWAGDGQSTLVWDWMITQLGGTGISIDLSPENAAVARSLVKRVEVKVSDSVIALKQEPELESLDLLYLDSYDWTGTFESPLHHAAEFAVAYPRLRSGCLIAIDDCFSDQEGKHVMVQDLLRGMGVEPVLRSRVTIWRKP